MQFLKNLLTVLFFFVIIQIEAQNKKIISFDSTVTKLAIGLKTGLNFATMRYSKPDYKAYKRSLYVRTIWGITGEYKINDHISFKPDLIYIGIGVKIKDGVNYKMNVKAFDINIPIVYTINNLFKNVSPYVLAGPSLSIVRKGVITLNQYSTDITKANSSATSLGLRVGGGVKYPFHIKKLKAYLCGEIAYNLGLTNTFSSKELANKSIGKNINPYNISGTRQARGVEASVSIMFPLHKTHVTMPKIKLPRLPKISVLFPPKKKKTETVEAPIVNQPGRFYTISEIVGLINTDVDVSNKKISMFNLTFDLGKSTVSKVSMQYLDTIVLFLKKYPSIKMKINGHADSLGNEDKNLKLSKDRAFSVYSYLVNKGIDASRLTYSFYGSILPIATNTTEAGRALNRRVEFEIQNGNLKIDSAAQSPKTPKVVSDVDVNIPAGKSSNPHSYALIFGNQDYSRYQLDLTNEVNVDFAVNDATTFKNYCTTTFGIPESNIKFYANATSGQMNQAIIWMNKIIQKEAGQAEVMVYYAGHGLPDEQTHESYIIPVDVSGSNLQSAIKLQTLYVKLTEFPSKRITVFMDACFSGGSRGQSLVATRGVKVKPKEGALTGNIVVFTSSSGEQSSLPYKDKQHGIFTYYLLKKIQTLLKGILTEIYCSKGLTALMVSLQMLKFLICLYEKCLLAT